MQTLTFPALALLLCVAAAAYLAGCCNGAIITSGLFFHDDIRQHGSGNAGLTNFYRVYGGKYAIFVILIDMLKAFVAVKLGSAVIGEFLALPREGAYFCALFCAIGHIFPAFYSFRGGKGILCSATLLLLLDWRIALVGWGLFALFVADNALCLARLHSGRRQLPHHHADLLFRPVGRLCAVGAAGGAGHLGAPEQYRAFGARNGVKIPLA